MQKVSGERVSNANCILVYFWKSMYTSIALTKEYKSLLLSLRKGMYISGKLHANSSET